MAHQQSTYLCLSGCVAIVAGFDAMMWHSLFVNQAIVGSNILLLGFAG